MIVNAKKNGGMVYPLVGENTHMIANANANDNRFDKHICNVAARVNTREHRKSAPMIMYIYISYIQAKETC